MRVKKYTGFEMAEILTKIREEMGPDAVILSSTRHKKSSGAFGMLSRPVIEVTAACDLDSLVGKSEPAPKPQAFPSQGVQSYAAQAPQPPPQQFGQGYGQPPRQGYPNPQPYPGQQGYQAPQPYFNPAPPPPPVYQQPYEEPPRVETQRVEPPPGFVPRKFKAEYVEPKEDATEAVTAALKVEIDSLREEMSLIAKRAFNKPADPVQMTLRALEEKLDRLMDISAKSAGADEITEGLKKLKERMLKQDLDPAVSSRIFSYLKDKIDQGALKEGREEQAFRELVGRTLRTVQSAGAEGRRVWAFVGPTGVGKTTTVAKLAARFALREGKKVGLITVDTFRIAAVEQLRTYANIMEVPIKVAMNAEDFKLAVADFADRDLILVDTAGQSPKDEAALKDLLELFPEDVDTQVHLVLSVTTRTRDLENILVHYGPLKASKLVLTKLDETDCRGPLLHLPVVSRLPLSYLTTGQNVPDDIEPASPEAVLKYLLGGAS